ncbi:hypothetical protein HTS88_15690 [Pseudarthrobacter oxydans]|uniref:hypothetical protein n=1 Tax=Pseudarthrobacter oxydans TaxID=1671 RepID=UPI001574B065|nr:hypothetical protein [Pseudarthrobacter oxydans]NSX37826.1 hypothetical protein [Pseudarthrobacter oxydans]
MKQTAVVVLLAAGLGLAGCSSATPEAAPATTAPASTPTSTKTATARPTASATPTPKPIATSGSYAADVTKLGIKPDNMQSYASWMKERICDQDSIGLGIAVRSVGGETPADGGGVDVVRLTNAYFCPKKTQEIEAELEYFGK